MTQNIEQRTEAAVKKYEGAAGKAEQFAETDSTVSTAAGSRKSFPKLLREIEENGLESFRLGAANRQGIYSVGATYEKPNWTYTYNGQQWGLSADFDLLLLPYETTEVDPNDDDNLSVYGSASTGYVNQAQGKVVGGDIYPESGVLENGDIVPDGTTRLCVYVDGKPMFARMSPVSSGVVSSLTQTSAIIGVTPVAFHKIQPTCFYVDSVNGSDANDGLSEATPLKTLAVAYEKLHYGDTLKLRGSSVFREMLGELYGKKLIHVDKYGAGVRPIVSGCDVISDFTLSSGNVYKTTITYPEASSADRGYATFFEDKKRLYEIIIGDDGVTDLATAIAAVEATPGSFYFNGDATAGWSANDSFDYYIHTSDSTDPSSNGKTYECSVRLKPVGRLFDGTISNCILEGGCNHDGFSGGTLVNCVILNPGRHGCLAPYSHKNTTIIGHNPRYSGGIFHSVGDEDPNDVEWIGCKAIGETVDYKDTVQDRSAGFFTHTTGSGIARERMALIDCEAHNVSMPISIGAVPLVDVVNFKVRDCYQMVQDPYDTANYYNFDGRSVGQNYNSPRPIQCSSGKTLNMDKVYVELGAGGWGMIYSLYGMGSVTINNFTFASGRNGSNGLASPMVEVTSNGTIDKLNLTNGYFVDTEQTNPNETAGDFIKAGAITEINIDEVMLVGFLQGVDEPIVNLASVDYPLSDINSGRVLQMSMNAITRGAEGKLVPKYGAWTPGSYIYSAVATMDYSDEPRGRCIVGDVITHSIFNAKSVSIIPDYFQNDVTGVGGAAGDRCFVSVGKNGSVYRGLNSTWDSVDLGITDELTSVCSCENADTGVVNIGGIGGIVYYSSDYGLTFSVRTSNTTENIRAAATFDGDDVVMVCDNGVIIYSTNRGVTFEKITVGSNDFFSVFYSNELSLWFAGGNDGALYSSPDMINWTSRKSFTKNRIVGFASGEDADVVIAACYEMYESQPTLLKTSDGITWEPLPETLPFRITGICGYGSNYYIDPVTVVGQSSYIARSRYPTGPFDIVNIMGDNTLQEAEPETASAALRGVLKF